MECNAAQLAVRGSDPEQIAAASVPPTTTQVATAQARPPGLLPRKPSLERRPREESPERIDYPYKRLHPVTPVSPSPRDRDRDRYDSEPLRRRDSPVWDRDRERGREYCDRD